MENNSRDDHTSLSPSPDEHYHPHDRPTHQPHDTPHRDHATVSSPEPPAAEPPVAPFVSPTSTVPPAEPVKTAMPQEISAAPAPALRSVQDSLMPQPVVKVLSPRGVEYVFMTIALVIGAIGLISALLSMINGSMTFSSLAFPVAMLLVAVPVFSWLFLRLKRTELLNPALALDASKRRSTQFIQIAGFITCFFTLIGFLTAVFAKMSGDYDGELWKIVLNALVILAVAGGILYYYWKDEHQA